MELRIKRIYEEPSNGDGFRVLVDRLWPRGVSKQEAALDGWFKEVAPSPELRTWFNHDPSRFKEFTARYEAELTYNETVKKLSDTLKKRRIVTLLYGAKDTTINHAVVLKHFMETHDH